jgi:hypothetical protein
LSVLHIESGLIFPRQYILIEDRTNLVFSAVLRVESGGRNSSAPGYFIQARALSDAAGSVTQFKNLLNWDLDIS